MEKFIKEKFHSSWYPYIKQLEKVLIPILTELNTQYNTGVIVPPKNKVFEQFKNLNLNNLKIVIINQEKFDDDVINVINDTIEETVYNGLNIHKEQDLKYWGELDILLLDRNFTIKKGHYNDHLVLWKPFIDAILSILESINTEITYLIWGEESYFYKDNISSTVYTCTTPYSGLSKNGFIKHNWKCDHFALTKHIIKW